MADITKQEERTKLGQHAAIYSILANVLLCSVKALAGILSGSVSIVADALNNLSDATSSIVNLIGFAIAKRPADKGHPFGHGRSEYLAALVVAALVMCVGIELVKESVLRILNPSPVDITALSVVILIASIAVKLGMWLYNARLGKQINSVALIATAVDARNDAITTSVVLIANLVAVLTGLYLDGWAGALVGAFIVFSALGLLKETVDPLLGKAPDPALVDHIRQKIMSYPGVLGTHDLMVHDYGPGRQFASAHVEMPAELNPLISHDTLDNIEQVFAEDDNIQVVLHYDPIVTKDPMVRNIRNQLAHLVRTIDHRLTVHDVRTVVGPTHTNVIFDCVKPGDLDMTDEELKEKISTLVCELHPNYRCVITIDTSFLATS